MLIKSQTTENYLNQLKLGSVSKGVNPEAILKHYQLSGNAPASFMAKDLVRSFPGSPNRELNQNFTISKIKDHFYGLAAQGKDQDSPIFQADAAALFFVARQVLKTSLEMKNKLEALVLPDNPVLTAYKDRIKTFTEISDAVVQHGKINPTQAIAVSIALGEREQNGMATNSLCALKQSCKLSPREFTEDLLNEISKKSPIDFMLYKLNASTVDNLKQYVEKPETTEIFAKFCLALYSHVESKEGLPEHVDNWRAINESGLLSKAIKQKMIFEAKSQKLREAINNYVNPIEGTPQQLNSSRKNNIARAIGGRAL